MLGKLTIEDFEGRVGETFGATAAGGRTLALTLRSAGPRESRPDAPRTAFALEFTDPRPDPVPQQTVAVEHAELGAFVLFVVPLGPGADGMRYQAIFT